MIIIIPGCDLCGTIVIWRFKVLNIDRDFEHRSYKFFPKKLYIVKLSKSAINNKN